MKIPSVNASQMSQGTKLCGPTSTTPAPAPFNTALQNSFLTALEVVYYLKSDIDMAYRNHHVSTVVSNGTGIQSIARPIFDGINRSNQQIGVLTGTLNSLPGPVDVARTNALAELRNAGVYLNAVSRDLQSVEQYAAQNDVSEASLHLYNALNNATQGELSVRFAGESMGVINR
jgi:hypothetical protein